jgi:hypothetical protein
VNAEDTISAVERLWTVKDVCEFLQRSPRWVYAHADELGATREFGGLRFDPLALRSRAHPSRNVLGFGVTNVKRDSDGTL